LNFSHNLFSKIISLENFYSAWREFRRGKGSRPDVQEFDFYLEDNLFRLARELEQKSYSHSNYAAFNINDPKPRRIHKASVRDRVVHQALFRQIQLLFDRTFIFDSYSCRTGKGTHRAVCRLEQFLRKATSNYHRNTFVLQCDIQKFFYNIDHNILFNLISKKVKDKEAIWLIQKVIKSFQTEKDKGLPLGNVTSQLFANVYLNELDQFAKHNLKARYYIRYCDDFLIINNNISILSGIVIEINNFLNSKLDLDLHPKKIIIKKLSQGVDFLDYINLPHYRVLRTRTKNRMLKRIKTARDNLETELIDQKKFKRILDSYFGLLSHCYGNNLKNEVKDLTKI